MSTHLADFVSRYPRLVVITGAGCSSPSGIPTYRNDAAEWQRPAAPITHQDFLAAHATRQRYWARSFAGWPPVRDASPNDAHHCLAELEARGHVQLLVTQNVDRLHQKAGHRRALDLHGRLDEVVCLECGDVSHRNRMQARLTTLNPALSPTMMAMTPDGDAEVDDTAIAALEVPGCCQCGGTLKPNVVFFGGSVDRAVVATVFDAIEAADAVLAVGTSLMVFSSFRFCRHASRLGKPLAILNRGRTRADELATLKVQTDCATALPDMLAALR